jgi:thioredoxin 1
VPCKRGIPIVICEKIQKKEPIVLLNRINKYVRKTTTVIKGKNALGKRICISIFLFFLAQILSCSDKDVKAVKGGESSTKKIKEINGLDHFKRIINSSGDHLLIFDLYAEWCMPCKALSPLLEEIASENLEKADFFKIDTDRHPDLSRMFNVSGIPHVSFVKGKIVLYSLTGLRERDGYVDMINRFTHNPSINAMKNADGKVVDGIRTITFPRSIPPINLYIYNGETVKLMIEKIDNAYSIAIPEFGVSNDAIPDKKFEISFTASSTGVFPMLCNGECPAGDGSKYGQIVVMPSKSS